MAYAVGEVMHLARTVRDIIVIGASRGGIQTICTLLGGLPRGLKASVLIALHASQQTPRFLTHNLGQCTALRVLYGEEGQAIERRHVYIAPPDYHLAVVVPGVLRLHPAPKARFSRSAADTLFHSAAAVYGSRAIAVVLTDSDGDGTEGLLGIRAAGGICVVQDPDETIAPDGPPNTLAPDRLNFKVCDTEMGALLTRLTNGLAA